MKSSQENFIEKAFEFIRPIWMWIRRISPKGTYIKLGEYWVKDPSIPKIDRLFVRTRNKVDQPDYEQNTVTALRKYIKGGDLVTIVGGGYGITGMVAIENGGKVTLIEASKERAQNIRDTWKQYKLKGSVIHGFVGSPISIWGELDGAKKIEVLPECDILELDCEGAEKEVLLNINFRPRIIIVESHGHLGSPSSLVKYQLENLGYRVIDEMVEHLENDIKVFVGEKIEINNKFDNKSKTLNLI